MAITKEQKRIYMRQRYDKGVCADCANPRVPNRVRCALHLVEKTEKAKLRYRADLQHNRARKREYMRAKYLANPEAAKALMRKRYERTPEIFRGYDMKRRYGITFQEYIDIETKQGGVCALCCQRPLIGKRAFGKAKQPPRLYVDHDHITGRIRGLLCHWCNSHTIAGIEKTGVSLTQVAEYLGMEVACQSK